MTQIPHGSETLVCPLHKKTMELVCHKCPWWFQVRGTNPNTGESVDEWRCAIAMLPLTMLEVSSVVRQSGAATESMRNGIFNRMDGIRPVSDEQQLPGPSVKLIAG